nr:MAG TPA_asm: acriflavine resistance protein B [Caudoviricetes sp.]
MNAKPEISTGHHSYIPCLGTLTATAPSFLPLVFLPALCGFFIIRPRRNHHRHASLLNPA